jgi:DNA-binding beta-propeller fold protein YncE
MRLLFVRIAVIAACVLFALQLSAQNPNNPIQLALLRWYQANTAAQLTTCQSPDGMAFDGSHIWLACLGPKEILEFNASDGALVRMVGPLAVPPYLLAYDGANIWATNYSAGTVIEVNASTGAVSGPFTVGLEPSGIVFDGKQIWVTNAGNNSISSVSISPTAGTVTNYPAFPAADCATPQGIAFDGTNLWVACHDLNTILQVSTSTGAMLNFVTVGAEPASIVFDGETGQTSPCGTGGPFVWVTNNSEATVSRVSITPPFALTSFPAGSEPSAIVFDGLYIWIANTQAGTVTKLSQCTGAPVGASPYLLPGEPQSMGFDGGNIYVSIRGGGVVSKM